MDNAPKKRILFAEDDQVAVDVVRKFLSQWYDVDVATTGLEAVQKCRSGKPDLVLMDLMMPGSSNYEGDEAIRQLTADPATASIPILVQTGFNDMRVIVMIAQAPNIVGVLLKPFDLALLKHKIQVILNSRAA